MDLATAGFALSPLIGLGACVLVHVLISRAAPGVPRVSSILVSALGGLGIVGAMGSTFVGRHAAATPAIDLWATMAAWLLTYVCLAYFYVFGFFNLGESARRIRLLIELHGAGEQGMTLEQILAAYNARMIVEIRLQRLLSGGQIEERDGRYFIKMPLMLYISKFLRCLKVLFLGVRSEFDRAVPLVQGRASLIKRTKKA